MSSARLARVPTTAERTMNAAKKASIVAPSTTVIWLPVLANTKSSTTEAILAGISKRRVLRASGIGEMSDEMPKMSRMFAKQLPTTLPNTMSA